MTNNYKCVTLSVSLRKDNNMTTTYTVTVPELFARDHWARGCMMIDVRWENFIIKRIKNKVVLELTQHQIRELHADADYYATSGSFRTPEFLGLVSSARAVRNNLQKNFTFIEEQQWTR